MKDNSNQAALVLNILGIVTGVISLPAVFCGGIFCLPLPVIGLVLNGIGFAQSKSKADNGRTFAIIGIIINILAILIFVCSLVFNLAIAGTQLALVPFYR